MREIKFRGKRHNGEWVYGSLVYYNNIDTAIHYEIDEVRRFDWCYVDSDTIGQFTGLLDKNGKEIYEGDVIHIAGHGFKEYDFGVVTWHKNGYFFVDDSFGKYEKTNVNPIGDFFDRSKHDFNDIVITVNGNIHDNLKRK